MATSVAGRFAGRTLYDFLKVAGSALSQAAGEAVLNKIGQTADVVDAPGLAGVIARNPEKVARIAGAAAPVAVAGGIAGTIALVDSLQQNQYSLPVQQSRQSMRSPAFSTQQYMPGMSPLTNDQMGAALLNQQRYQHQLDLIRARQNASSGAGGLSAGSDVSDIIGLARQIYG